MSRPKVLAADDHQMLLDGLRRILEPDFEFLEPVTDGRALVSAVQQCRPDLILIDVTMPMLNGIEAMRQILNRDSSAKIVILTMHEDLSYAVAAMEAGASGYVLKQEVSAVLLQAAKAVLNGETFISAKLRETVRDHLQDRNAGRKRKNSFQLTERQREVLQLIAEGRTAKEIGTLLDISARTAEFHKRELRRLMGARTTAELVQQAIRIKLITPPGTIE